jgi:hypothetical protein
MPITIARPYDEEELKREMGRVQARYQPGPMPEQEKSLARTVAETAGVNALDKGADKGTDMVMSKLGSMFAPKAAASGMLPGQLYSGMAPSVLATSAPGAASSGIMAGLSGAGSSAMAGLGALVPIGLGLGGIMLAKKFGLFNQGGSVGPLSPQYKERGDEIETPKSKPRYLMYPYQSNVEAPMPRPRPMTYGEAYDKAYGKYGFEHSEPENKLGKSLYHGFNKALSPSIALDAKVMQWMHNKEMRDAGVPGFNQGGDVQYKEHGGMMAGPLSNNKSVKIEKKETIEYKN